MPLIPKAALERLETANDPVSLARQREDFILEAKMAVSRALKDAGHEALFNAICGALDGMAGRDAVTDVTLCFASDDER